MKSYTNLEQSKKLAEFLPLESADMCWTNHCYGSIRSSMTASSKTIEEYKELLTRFGDLTNIDVFYPCWSLNSLIYILPDTITDEDGTIFGLNIKKNFIEYYNPSMGALYATYHSIIAEDLVDACYEMIIKLKEKGLL